MPLSTDDSVNKTAGEIKDTMKAIFGTPAGFRPAHAKGLMLSGTFTPTSAAASISSAPHFNAPSTPVTARFSSSTGIPVIPDTDPNGDPRGFALRFNLPERNGRRVHTDIVTHSVPFFPMRTGQGFLDFLHALIASNGSTEKPSPIEKFLGANPSALAFVQAPKPTPVSFANEPYFGVTAFKAVSKDGAETYIRYIVKPAAGVETLDAAGLEGKGPNFLYEKTAEMVKEGPIVFNLQAQLAEDGDVTDDATVHWPESRKVVELGEVRLDRVLPEGDQAAEQKKIIFDPIPRVEGLEASADPLLEMRASLYIQSGKERRAA